MRNSFVFTSESVLERRPDTASNHISGAVWEGLIAGDSISRSACDTLVNTGMVALSGEGTSNATVFSRVRVAYAVRLAKPVSLMVNPFGAGLIPEVKIARAMHERADLLRPIRRNRAVRGEFTRSDTELSWEHTDTAAALCDAAGLGTEARTVQSSVQP